MKKKYVLSEKQKSIAREYSNIYRKLYPWLRSYNNAKQRCEVPTSISYKNYGAKGIKFLMTKEDFKTLWFRDKAHLLTVPSIDRLDSKKDYTFDNCHYIERRVNCSKHVKNPSGWNRYGCCSECKTTSIKHIAFNLCDKCYKKAYKAGIYPLKRYKTKQKGTV